MTARVTDEEISIGLRCAVVGAGLVFAAVVLGVLIALEADPIDVDVWWNGFVNLFAPVLSDISLFMNFVGGGWFATYVVPLAGAALLVLIRRPWSGLMFVVASALSAAAVQVLKTIFGRARPEDMLVISDHGSFPSGHTANAATIAALAVLLFPRVWVAIVGAAWTLLMAFSRTQVHAHWFSDTVGGTLVGVGMALVVAGAFTVPLIRERERALLQARADEATE
ncbi:phosphatase PAP2 family protein [Microbacterium sp. bgisy189]|uniref:phosphatase PAP2 family protein n=1 Tax=Microbacterium sp. bgisy189 TaxID=3413798 RepID=UPI003EBDA8D0